MIEVSIDSDDNFLNLRINEAIGKQIRKGNYEIFSDKTLKLIKSDCCNEDSLVMSHNHGIIFSICKKCERLNRVIIKNLSINVNII